MRLTGRGELPPRPNFSQKDPANPANEDKGERGQDQERGWKRGRNEVNGAKHDGAKRPGSKWGRDGKGKEGVWISVKMI